MKKLAILPALFFFLSGNGQADWKQGLRYNLSVRLDDQQQALEGKMDLSYRNRSPDTLHFIWFQAWPNAYRNDKTDYSEQRLANGSTDFYFSGKERRGYINRMEFRVDGQLAEVQDHPEYQDVIKLILPHPLAPGDSLHIAARFHVRLPFNFSGSGYRGHQEQISNWYPEPAVYDRQGWHPMPLLDQGGAYHEAADYQVSVDIPKAYVIAAPAQPDSVSTRSDGFTHYHFSLQLANGFCWMADKKYLEKTDSVTLQDGRRITLQVFYFRRQAASADILLREAGPLIQQMSTLLSPFPYSHFSIVETIHAGDQRFSGMLAIDSTLFKKEPAAMIRRELIRQWFQTICLSDERKYPWLSRGLIAYYDHRLQPVSEKRETGREAWRNDRLWLAVAEKERTVQPINTPAADLSPENYQLVAGTGAAIWIKSLEDSVGQPSFDNAMRAYTEKWKGAHPYPKDFQEAMQNGSGKNLSGVFESIHTDRPAMAIEPKRPYRPVFAFSVRQTDRYRYLGLAPMVGYNRYDQLMAGAIIHNINLPRNNFEFVFVPLYGTGSKTLTGLGSISYSWFPDKYFRKITLGVLGSTFSSNYAKDSTGSMLFEKFARLVPYLRFDFPKRNPRSTLEKWMDLKSYLITEKTFSGYALSTKDSSIHPNALASQFRYLNQWSINLRDNRILYPYDARLELQQSDLFYRINLTAHYFFNYPTGGGLSVRFFAAKFGAWNADSRQDLSRYEPKLLGNNGDEDYTYDHYFVGRSSSYALEGNSVANGGLPAQQIMIRDGGLKMRLDAYPYLEGRSANWVTAVNFSTSLPAGLFPFPLPIRLFLDAGTYAEGWQTNAPTSRFLYTGGVQLSLFHNVLNIYAPLLSSKDFSSILKTEGFGRKITFSIDVEQLDSHSKGRIMHDAFRSN